MVRVGETPNLCSRPKLEAVGKDDDGEQKGSGTGNGEKAVVVSLLEGSIRDASQRGKREQPTCAPNE